MKAFGLQSGAYQFCKILGAATTRVDTEDQAWVGRCESEPADQVAIEK